MKKIENIAYGSEDALQALDIYLPDTPVSAVVVYFHGGGLEVGDKACEEKEVSYLVERGVAFVNANYRMYPNAEYPDFIYDAAKAVAWANGYMRKELNCDKLYVSGGSAGGYISMMLCFDKKYLASVGLDNSVISGYFHDAGQPTAHFNVLKYKNIDPRRIIVDETAPLYYIGVEKEYPPMRFIVSDNDMENRYEQIMLTLSTLSHFGYEKFDYVLMHGTHCEYGKKFDGNGQSIYMQMIYDFIGSVENGTLRYTKPEIK